MEDQEDDLHSNSPRESLSEKVVLPPDKLKKRVNYILQKLIIEHSPKEVVDWMFNFIHEYYKGDKRIDVALKEFLEKQEQEKEDKNVDKS
jgi:hypothetical protein|tara:strand:+ start:136 stop:405 length:270 start_codon:yes stop_codon:yes gene_type:complete